MFSLATHLLPETEAFAEHGKAAKIIYERAHVMKRTALLVFVAATAACVTAGVADDEGSPVYGVKIPAGFREWSLINVAHEAADLNDFRVVLGNAIAMKAFQEGTLPFPDGTFIARLAWKYVPSEENNAVFGRAQSFVTGAPTNLEFMVKDSKRYAASGGWGFGQFTNGKPDDEALHKTCFPCHQPAKGHDLVFTRYAPSP